MRGQGPLSYILAKSAALAALFFMLKWPFLSAPAGKYQ
jgi:hypothetical protein